MGGGAGRARALVGWGVQVGREPLFTFNLRGQSRTHSIPALRAPLLRPAARPVLHAEACWGPGRHLPCRPAPAGAVPARLITGVRLEGGPTPREGRLLVKVGGKWGAVVNKSLSDTDAARAVCRQLGYSGAAAARGAAYYGRSKAPPVLQILSCQPWGRRGRRPRDGLQGCTLTRSIDPQDPNSSDGFGVWCAGAFLPAV